MESLRSSENTWDAIECGIGDSILRMTVWTTREESLDWDRYSESHCEDDKRQIDIEESNRDTGGPNGTKEKPDRGFLVSREATKLEFSPIDIKRTIFSNFRLLQTTGVCMNDENCLTKVEFQQPYRAKLELQDYLEKYSCKCHQRPGSSMKSN
ncbi:hypothetical protein HHI36_014047 [Cryptolaemus montrouzieri]|uniref:Uncharacterized protein n=1 Tax=Cryptolaemus montrouzieri TaxID=559131 RepID=A0ABD2N2D6_9CUCU